MCIFNVEVLKDASLDIEIDFHPGWCYDDDRYDDSDDDGDDGDDDGEDRDDDSDNGDNDNIR